MVTKPMTLNVMIPCRDRLNMTQKTIESIHKNSTLFQNIHIYCFDNLSELSSERLGVFQDLLKRKLISYYSYDTTESLYNCFGKAVSFQRWLQMMIAEMPILEAAKRNVREVALPENSYYMLLDNDMILCDRWDEYFVSAANQCKDSVHFLVKWPGGCPGSKTRMLERSKVVNQFSENEQFEIVSDDIGGASGLWFMTRKMLPKLLWEMKDVAVTYGRFKKHDSTAWGVICKRNSGKRLKYVARVVPPDVLNYPLALHLGGVVGSMCNSLTSNSFTENSEKFQQSDDDIKNLSVDELISRYKNIGAEW